MAIRRLPPSQQPTAPGATSVARHTRVAAPTEGLLSPSSPAERVGYKNPPRHTRFKPGQSGNPKGRPKSAKGLKAIVRDTLTQKVSVRTASGEKRISKIEAVIHKFVEQAMKGQPRPLVELLKLYSAAVPESATQSSATSVEDFSDTDFAILEALRNSLLGNEEVSDGPA